MTISLIKGKKKGNYLIKGTTLLYCKHTGFGELQLDEKEVEDKPHMNHQWSVDVLITKEIAKKLKEAHKKFSKKEKTAAEFKKAFKVDPPFEAEEYYTVKLYKEAFYSKSGDPAPRLKVVDAKRNSLEEVEIGNGTTADVVLNISDYNHATFGKGTSMRLSAIKVTNLVEYSGGDASDEFDFDEDDDFDEVSSDTSEAEEDSSDSDTSEEPWD